MTIINNSNHNSYSTYVVNVYNNIGHKSSANKILNRIPLLLFWFLLLERNNNHCLYNYYYLFEIVKNPYP